MIFIMKIWQLLYVYNFSKFNLWNTVSNVTWGVKPHLIKGGDCSQDVFTTAVLWRINSMQLNPIKLHTHVYLSDINYFNNIIMTVGVKTLFQNSGAKHPMLYPYSCYCDLWYMGAPLYMIISKEASDLQQKK